ncbi:MFS transporter [Paraburkholderia aspalathi]|uniref:MFS-type transporter involved in bile tolerance, Atg22 family n=1 Tax=Paraburkholderia aspalathi TaxID=1324617 RepID=A0A1I7EJI4_9BURK|nr:MFS transporter [Paraburkholderia aspalathi]SFU24103.1 MFS-type transporter involved in bile tolerance, Atg22 family [Paraburkholderia aspalathi]
MSLLALFLFQGIAGFTGQLLNFALIWQILNWYHSPFLMSVCSGVGIVINLVLTPWIGQLVDRSHRLKVAAGGDLLSVVVSCGLFLCLPALHGQRSGVVVIIIAYALRALATQIQSTAFMAALADMSDDVTRGRIFARWQTVVSVAGLVAVPMSAALMSVLRLDRFVLIDLAAVSVAVVNAWRVALRTPMHAVEPTAAESRSTAFQDLKATWKYLREDAALTTFLLALPFINFVCAPISTLLPPLIKLDWHLDVKSLAIAETLLTIGILAASMLQSVWTPKVRREYLIVAGLFALTASIGMIGGWSGATPFLLYSGMLACGLSVMFVRIPLRTAIATSTPESMRGRVDSVMLVLGSVAAPIGLLAFGAMVELTSSRSAVWVGTVLLGAMILVLAIRVGGMRRRSNVLQS